MVLFKPESQIAFHRQHKGNNHKYKKKTQHQNTSTRLKDHIKEIYK